MTSQKNSKKFVAVIDQDKIEPDLARETVINYDPLNRAGKEGGFYIDENEELHIDDDDVMEAHKMAANKYPYDGAVQIVQLIHEEGDKIHQFGENTFRLYGLPQIDEGAVIGVLGENGSGKSTALKILSGDIKPNLGNYKETPEWGEIKKKFRGTALQTHFKQLANNNLRTAYKPQNVENIPKAYEGTVKELLEKNEERKTLEQIKEEIDLEKLLDRNLSDLSGGELQRVAIASTLMKEKDLYLFDEPSSFLDVKQRLKIGQEIRKLAHNDKKKVIVVEHDLATLDLLSDRINIFYGDPGSYGMVSNTFTTKEGINKYLEGHLPSQNLKIRTEKLEFIKGSRSKVENNKEISKYPKFEKDFGDDEFKLKTEKGRIRKEEIKAIFGQNGLGKTVFAKMLVGSIKPDNTESPNLSISHKPQYLKAKDETVRKAVSKHVSPENKRFQTRIAEPLNLEKYYERNLQDLSGGELQKVGIGIALSRDADFYLLDEPSAFLDVDSRVKLAKTLKRFARKSEKPLMVIDHDLMLLDYISDTGKVFKGEPGIKGYADETLKIHNALNEFLKEVDTTFRKDPETGRPRANKPGSRKDKEQKKSGKYYER